MMILSVDAPPEVDQGLPQGLGPRPADLGAVPRLFRAMRCRAISATPCATAGRRIQLVLERVPATLAITVPAFCAQARASAFRPASTPRCTAIRWPTALDHDDRRSRASPCRASCWRWCWCWSSPCSSAGCPRPAATAATSAILPIVTLGVAGAAILARFTRSADARGAGPALYPRRLGQGPAVAQGRGRACAAQCRDPDHDHRRLHGRHADRRRRGGRKRVRLARHRPAAGVVGVQPRPRRRAGDPAAGRRDHGDVQHHRRLRSTAGSIRACAGEGPVRR